MPSNIDIKFFTCEHRGGLVESMKTIKYITKKQFNNYLKTNKYKYYAYDNRVFQYLFILTNMPRDFKKYPNYIGIEVIEQYMLFDPENTNI